MFSYLKRLYLEGRLSEQGLDNALTRKPVPWLTQEQVNEIKKAKEEQGTAPEPAPVAQVTTGGDSTEE